MLGYHDLEPKTWHYIYMSLCLPGLFAMILEVFFIPCFLECVVPEFFGGNQITSPHILIPGTELKIKLSKKKERYDKQISLKEVVINNNKLVWWDSYSLNQGIETRHSSITVYKADPLFGKRLSPNYNPIATHGEYPSLAVTIKNDARLFGSEVPIIIDNQEIRLKIFANEKLAFLTGILNYGLVPISVVSFLLLFAFPIALFVVFIIEGIKKNLMLFDPP